MQDNLAYQYALSQNYTEPEIFFDDKDELDKSLGYLRLIFKQFLEASHGDVYRLHVLMSLFAGNSLREVAKSNKKSHEYARIILNSIEKTHPELFKIIKTQKYKVPCITPKFSKIKYLVYDRETHCYTYYKTLGEISRKYEIKYSYIKDYKKIKYFRNKYKITRLSIIESHALDKED